MAMGDKAKNTSRVQQGNTETRERAVAWLNFDLPTRSGEKKRFVSLGLMESDEFHKQVIDYLADPETREAGIEMITKKLILTVNFIKTGDAAVLDL